MIDPITASTAVLLLSPYFAKAGEKFAEKVGEKLAEKTSQIYQVVKEKFSGDEYAGLTLLRLEETPESDSRQSALENVIKEKMEDDDRFAEKLKQLVKEAQEIEVTVLTASERSVLINGNVDSSLIITGSNNNINDKT